MTTMQIPAILPSRRAFLLAATFAPEAFGRMAGRQQGFWESPRWVWLKRPQTGEEVRTYYWAQGELIPDGYKQVCWFLRDAQLGKGMYMSLVLLDMLYATSAWLHHHGIARAIETTSGARFPETNARIESTARNSLHMEGRAHDGRIPGISLQSMQELGLWLGGGGVGYYPGKNFCHWDDGRIRHWKG